MIFIAAPEVVGARHQAALWTVRKGIQDRFQRFGLDQPVLVSGDKENRALALF